MNLKPFKHIISYIRSFFPFLTSLYLATLGLGWICFYLYVYIFATRPIYKLHDVEITNTMLFIFSYFILIHLMIIGSSIWSLIVKHYSIVPKGRFKFLFEKVHTATNYLIWDPLEYIHDKVAPHIPESGNFFYYLAKAWESKKPIFFNIIIFFLNVLPRILLALIFFIDIVIYAEIKYFVYCIYLALIPIGFNVFLKLFVSFAERCLITFRDMFQEFKFSNEPLKEVPANVLTGAYTQVDDYKNALNKSYYIAVINPEYDVSYEEIGFYFDLHAIVLMGNMLKTKLSNISPYVLMITSSIYLIAGIYRLGLLLVWF